MPPPKGHYFYKDKTSQELLKLVKEDPSEFQYVTSEDQTIEMQKIAVNSDPDRMIHVSKPSKEFIEWAVENHPSKIEYLPFDDFSEEMWVKAIKVFPENLKSYVTMGKTINKNIPNKYWSAFIRGIIETKTSDWKLEMIIRRLMKEHVEIPIFIQFMLFMTESFDYFKEKGVFPSFDIFSQFPEKIKNQIFVKIAKSDNYDSNPLQALIKLYSK